MALGYRGNPAWRDMSEYVVHFTRKRQDMVDMLLDDRITAGKAFGWARDVDGHEGTPTQKSVCLSEVPLDLLDRLVDRHGPYGLGFRKVDLVPDQAAPVWYVPMDTHLAGAVDRLRWAAEADPELRDAVFTLTRYIDKVGKFPNGSTYEFEWEREWRVPRRLDLWREGPLFLFAPEGDHEWLDAQLDVGHGDALGDGVPPIIDPAWDDEKIQQVLVTLTA